jgi:hypothetical protein
MGIQDQVRTGFIEPPVRKHEHLQLADPAHQRASVIAAAVAKPHRRPLDLQRS